MVGFMTGEHVDSDSVEPQENADERSEDGEPYDQRHSRSPFSTTNYISRTSRDFRPKSKSPPCLSKERRDKDGAPSGVEFWWKAGLFPTEVRGCALPSYRRPAFRAVSSASMPARTLRTS